MKKFLVLNGPNINLLGQREPEIYGAQSYDDLLAMITAYAQQHQVDIDCRQSNHEGTLVDILQAAKGHYDGIVLNPAAYTHTSIALLDTLQAIQLPTVEVHISDPEQREAFRHISYIRPACIATICGKGLTGYLQALDLLLQALADAPCATAAEKC